MENKNGKLLIVVVVILSVLVLGLGGYIIYDKLFQKNEESELVEKNIKNNDIIYKEEATIYLNNNPHTLTYEYYYEEDDYEKYGEQFYYIVRMNVLLDDKEINFSDNFIYFHSTIDHKSAKEIESYLKNNSQIVKPINKTIESSDKDYLFIDLEENHDNLSVSLRLVIDENKNIVYNYDYGLTGIDLKETTEGYEKFKVKDYYIENGILYHLYYQHETISEEEQAGAYIHAVALDNDINISKRFLNQDEYTGYGIK